MIPEASERLKLLLKRALELEGEERTHFIEELRCRDNNLADLLTSHLRETDQQTRTLEPNWSPFSDHGPFAIGGTILGRFRIERLLGTGGMGEVYEATDLELGKVALKTIRQDIANEPETLAGFRSEVRLARRVISPYVCRIHELFVISSQGGRPASAFLTMELLEGQTLSDRIEKDGRLPWRDAESIARQVCNGLQTIHEAGIIHRDLKSRNIMLAVRNGAAHAVIMDFGLARRATANVAAAGTTVSRRQPVPAGTPEYMAPEQFEGSPLSHSTDVYALGVVLYEMVTGIRPFAASSMLGTAVRRARRPTPVSSIQNGVPRRWNEIIERCLEYEPKDRFQSAVEVADALAATPFSPAGLRRKLKTLPAHPRTAAALFACIATASLLALLWLFEGRYRPASPEAYRWYGAGVAALREGTYLKAENALKQALAVDNTFALAHARLADAYNELDYYSEAKDELLRASSLSAAQNLPRLDKRYLEAIRATVLHDFTAALRAYRSILSVLPASAKADGYIDLGRAYERIGDLPRAIMSYSAATRLGPEYPAAFVGIGTLEGRQNHIQAAEAAFSTAEKLYRALSNYEGIAEIDYRRGDIAASNLDLEHARALLTQALVFAHDHSPQLEARVLCRLSALEHLAGNNQDAEKWATQALSRAQAEGLGYWAAEADCRLATAYIYPWTDAKGRAYSRLAEADKRALQALQAAERNGWPLIAAGARFTLALIRDQEGRPAESLPFAQAASEYYRQAGYFTESTRAMVITLRGELDAAKFPDGLSLCKQGLDLEKKSGNPPVMIQMEEAAGELYVATERFPEALGHFQAAAATARQNGSNLLDYEIVHVADALWRLGEYGGAEQDLNSVAIDATKDDYLASSVNTVLAEMRSSQGRNREAIAAATRSKLLDPSAPSPALDALIAIAYLHLGARKDALRFANQALREAQAGLNQVSLARAEIAAAEAYLKISSPGRAKPFAESALAVFSKLGMHQSEWQAFALLSSISLNGGDRGSSKKYASKSLDILSALEHNWGTSASETYEARPDVKIAIRDLYVLRR